MTRLLRSSGKVLVMSILINTVLTLRRGGEVLVTSILNTVFTLRRGEEVLVTSILKLYYQLPVSTYQYDIILIVYTGLAKSQN